MPQKRPRVSDGTALASDDNTDDEGTVKRQHVESAVADGTADETIVTVHAAAHSSSSVSPIDGEVGNVMETADAALPHQQQPQPPPPPPPQQLPRLTPALLFRPRQLLTVTAPPAASATPHPQSVVPAVIPQLPVLQTIDWRSTDEAEDAAGEMEDEESDIRRGVADDIEDEEQSGGDTEQPARDAAVEMELDVVVSRLHSLIIPRRVTFGRRQPMPIIRPTRIRSEGSLPTV